MTTSNKRKYEKKGRRYGTNNPKAVLDWDKVDQIRSLYPNTPAKEIWSRHYASSGISYYAIRDVCVGRTWKEEKRVASTPNHALPSSGSLRLVRDR